MDLKLSGRRVLITGASRGIGAGTADAFAREGCNLVLVARDAERLTQLARGLRSEFNVVVDVVAADLTDPQVHGRLGDVGSIDILVNNAGAIPGGDLQSVDAVSWRRAWDLKVYGYIDVCRMFYRQMKANGGGVIINNIGASAEFFDPDYIAGCTANAGLVAFTRALGARSLDDAIRVIGVSPGPVATDRLQALLHRRPSATNMIRNFPRGRPADVGEIADLIVFLASPRSAYTSGVVFTVDGGLSARHAP